jgi:hypothetical protein
MALPQYPTADLDQGRLLLEQLGSFWTNIFRDVGVLQSHMRSNANEQGQSYLGYLEAVACVSRFTVPVFHREYWHLFVLSRNVVVNQASVYQPNDLQYGPQDGTVPGRPVGFVQTYGGQDKVGVVKAPLPDKLANIPFTIHNKVVLPSQTLMSGLDFTVDTDSKMITFRTNPFNDPLFVKRDVFDSAGIKIDEEVALWVYLGDFDLDYVYIQFGYALGIKYASSQEYKDLLNAVWDMFVMCLSRESLQQFLSAMSGVPFVLETEETIEVVRVEADRQLIITDQHVYQFKLSAVLLYSSSDVGTKLYHGQALCTAVLIEELAQHDPNYSVLPSVALSRGLLSGGYLADLTFRNANVQLEYLGLDEYNKAVVRFDVSGFPGDVEAFWNAVNIRGVVSGKMLSEYLDTRVDPTTPPLPMNLPSVINPLEFILSNLMRNNLFVIRVRYQDFADNVPGLGAFQFLRDVIPPHTTYIVFVDLTVTETIDLAQAGGEDDAGAEEDVTTFLGATPFAEDLFEAGSAPPGAEATYQDAFVKAYLVSSTCQE